MKLVFLALTLLSFNSFATQVDGKITYKLPSGDLVDRQVVLETPSRGQGEVILSGKKFEWRTKKFQSFNTLGKDTFVAIFDTKFMGTQSTLVFKGTYLKGSNKLLYTGDIYKTANKKTRHLGVFSFEYDR